MRGNGVVIGSVITFFVILILSIAACVLGGAAIIWLCQHPAAVGEFFGNIVKGFNSAAK